MHSAIFIGGNYLNTTNFGTAGHSMHINNYELIGWQTKDIYQNTAVTLLYSIKLNQVIDEKIFKTPLQN